MITVPRYSGGDSSMTARREDTCFVDDESVSQLPTLASAEEQGLTNSTQMPGWHSSCERYTTIDRSRNFIVRPSPPWTDRRPESAQEVGITVVPPEHRSPEYLQKFVRSEIEKWAVIIKGGWHLGDSNEKPARVSLTFHRSRPQKQWMSASGKGRLGDYVGVTTVYLR